MKHIVSLSGGKDSTAMLLMMIERGLPIDYVIFVDTTKEFPEIYEHIGKLERYISPLKITKLSFDYDYYFSEYIRKKGLQKGKKGYGFPTMKKRWCTSFKSSLTQKFIKSLKDDYIIYVGIAYDEAKRAKPKPHYKYPLVEWRITEKEALAFCYSRGFNFGGLYEKITRSSCYCCPLVSIKKLEAIYHYYPELWEQIKEMEKKVGQQFRLDYSTEALEKRFQKKLYLEF